jgi:transcriptional regulator with XRE-family HTH domain
MLTTWPERLVPGIVLAVPRSLPPDPALATALRRLREDRGMAQEALAFRSGISTGAIARIELGQASPAWVTVSLIADALGVSLVELATAVESER